jgi:hypothetical protein
MARPGLVESIPMRKILPLATGTVFLGLLTLTVFVLDPACLPHHPFSGKNPSLPTWAEILDREAQLIQEREDLNRYVEAKKKVAKKVIEGQRSLAEAIDDFRKLDQMSMSPSTQERALLERRCSEEEWLGRNVIYFACRVLVDRPDEATAVADRLEKELQKILADRKKQSSVLADPPNKAAP